MPTPDKPIALTAGPAVTDLDFADTLIDHLQRAAVANAGALVHVRAEGEEVRQTYAALLEDALRIGHGLRAAGVAPGDFVLLQLERSEDFIPGLWGCIAAGAVPAPVAVAPTFGHATSALQKLVNAGKLLERCFVLASGAASAGLATMPPELGRPNWTVLDLQTLRTHSAAAPVPRTNEDVAVLLLTSGSTGQPKGVPLTHRNLLAMATGTVQACGFTPQDVTLNWMALDHAGAVSFLGTMAVVLGCTQIHVPTGHILQDPLRWLDLIERHRATISWAPNFAFTLFLERAEALAQRQWDLRCMRFLVNAGEPVVARTARRFIRLLQRHGLPADALRPAFGMSETCSGITWSRGFTLENSADDQPFVDLGPCIAGAAMRIVDDRGEVLGEDETGLLQLRGPSVFGGYLRNPVENAEVLRDGWFTTGDLAYLRGGCLHISGRRKDVIIINGANFYCHEIESVAETTPGVRKTFTAACAVRDANAETDQLALFFCPENADRTAVEQIAKLIRGKLVKEAGVPATFVVALEPADVPKTEIGKIQRAKLKAAFEAGSLRDRIVGVGGGSATHARNRPHGDLTAAIAKIWQDVLGVESVGYDDTFFELGGHSLLVVQVQARLQELIGRPVPVVELFNCPTVRTMAAHFAQETNAPASVEAARRRAPEVREGSADIAIIGIGLRFPGAKSPAEFWQLLADEREAIQFFTAEDALRAGVKPELVRDPNFVKAAPVLDAPEAFDAEFFRYSAKEARLIDPQQRVFLEICWEAFEDAGYDPLTLPEKVGVFAAAGLNTYLANHLLANRAFLEEENGGRMLTVDSMSGFNIMITNDKDYLPTRVSYKLNLRGPSMNVQTACSSTLLTLHQACNSLRLGDCALALAGGVSIKLPQHAGHLYSAGMLNSPDGHCRAYDERAEGTIFGNGAGVVLLKPLAKAVADGDHLYAVIKASATNNDGAGKVAYTAPSTSGEAEVCAEAIARAGIDPATITFMEGHGTGTALGDPIEVEALTQAFGPGTPRRGYCALGSVKTNVGHLQIASGVAGLIKTALALHHRRIPGTLHFEKPNPRIDFTRTPFFVNRHTIPWESDDGPRRAGVNSLGIGGSNVHVILEEAPPRAQAPAGEGAYLLPLSARHPEALRQLARRYADFLRANPTCALADLAFTAQTGRAALPWRAAFVGDTSAEFIAQLEAFAAAEPARREPIDFETVGLSYHFGGDSTGLAGAAALSRGEPGFRVALERCLALFGEDTAAAAQRMLNGPGSAFVNGHGPTEAVQNAALFAYEYALAEWLAAYGVKPAACVGVGVGRHVAECTSGHVTLAEAALAAIAEPSLRAAATRVGRNGGSHTYKNGVAPEPAEAGAVVELGAKLRLRLADELTPVGPLGLLADLFVRGYPLRWADGRRANPARRIPLPTYPWQHRAYWIEAADLIGAPASEAIANPLIGRRWQSPRIRETLYETQLTPTTLPYLAEHRVHGRIVVPAAFFLAQVAAQAADHPAARLGEARRSLVLSDVQFVATLVIDPAEPRIVQTVFTPETDERDTGWRFEIISFTSEAPNDATKHVTGRASFESSFVDTRRASAALNEKPREVAAHYAVMDAMKVALGPGFRWIHEIRSGEGTATVRLEPPAELAGTRGWHPGLVDSFLQAAVPAQALDGSRTLIPWRIDRLAFHDQPSGGGLRSAALRREPHDGDATMSTDVQVSDGAGRILADVTGFALRELPADYLPVTSASAAELACLRLDWEKASEPTVPMPAMARGNWLLLADPSELAAKVKTGLEAYGQTVTQVASDDRATAERHLRSDAWAGVVFGWSLSAQHPAEIDWPGLLACIQAAAGRADGISPRWVFLADAQRRPAQAPLAGFVAGLAQEFPEWRPLHVEFHDDGREFARQVPRLLAADFREARVALRDGGLYAARLAEMSVPAAAIRLRTEASYLVVGASGALGQSVAEWLIAHGARNVVLSGRQPVPAALAQRIGVWTASGLQVAYEQGDVADPSVVRGLVARAEKCGPLRGVFHTAGSLCDGMLRQADGGAFAAVLPAKTEGAWNLHLATADKSLDHFVLFSSIASVLGSPAQANYAAANAFLDGLAEFRRARGLPALSVQWGPWDGGGMTTRLPDRDRRRLLERGLAPMAPSDALRALEGLLAMAQPCAAVLSWNRERYRQSLGTNVPALYRGLLTENSPATPVPTSTRSRANRFDELARLAMAERTEAIEQMIRESVAAVLGFGSPLEVEREKSLFEIGLDSLTAVDVKNRLEKSLGATLRATIAFDYPTVATMAPHLAQTLFSPAPAAIARQAIPAIVIARAKTAPLAELSAADLTALLQEELER